MLKLAKGMAGPRPKEEHKLLLAAICYWHYITVQDYYIENTTVPITLSTVAVTAAAVLWGFFGIGALGFTALWYPYQLAFGAAFSLIPDGSLGVTAGIFTLSRALSAWAVVSFPKAKKDGLAASFSRTAAERTVRGTSVLWGILGVCLMAAACGPLMAAACTLAAGLAFVCYRRMALAEFGGITGDLAGYFLQRAELWQLMAAAAVCAVRPIL